MHFVLMHKYIIDVNLNKFDSCLIGKLFSIIYIYIYMYIYFKSFYLTRQARHIKAKGKMNFLRIMIAHAKTWFRKKNLEASPVSSISA